MKVCVIVQGQVYPEILSELLETYKDFEHKILSTWTTENVDCVNICREAGFQIVVQDPPEFRCAANYQVKSIYAACQYATEHGYTHALRMRTDVKVNDIRKLLSLLSTEKLSFLTMYQNHDDSLPYLTDFIAYGPIDKLQKYFSKYQLPDDARWVELFLMETYFDKIHIRYEDIMNEIELMHTICFKENIVIEFTKPCYRHQGDMNIRHFINNRHPKSLEYKELFGL